MRIVSVLENQTTEKRIAITPEIAKKYIALGLEVSLSESYADHLGIKDNEYSEAGVKISKDEKEIINSADIIVQLGLPSDEKISLISGWNPISNYQINESYTFSELPKIWGWATWKRSWLFFDREMKSWPQNKKKQWIN